jgi:medium-chain acyl-[acyl-carrier-protein] hydrolase
MRSARPSPWFVVPRPQPGARIRLFCFPYAGGGVQTYVEWRRTLHPLVELVAVQPPGRGPRQGEAAHRTMDALIADLWPRIAPMLDRPYILFGHSMGSRMAYALAARARAEGARLPTHFVASGSGAPHLPHRERHTYDLPRADFIASLRELGGTPEEILGNPELIDMFLPLLRADFELAERHRADPDAPFEFGASILGGTDDPWVSRDDLTAWQAHFRRPVRIQMCEGGHLFIERDPAPVVAMINGLAERYLGGGAPPPASLVAR